MKQCQVVQISNLLSQPTHTPNSIRPLKAEMCPGQEHSHASDETAVNKADPSTKPFKCTKCGKEFTSASERKEHLRSHQLEMTVTLNDGWLSLLILPLAHII